ncbi:MAG: 3-hydroxyacyl-CoA dehydrogenase NAD-binding domain-containing protein [Bosea sp. (in: a-proteobacteria)]
MSQAHLVITRNIAAVRVIEIDNPPVNAISQAVRKSLMEALAHSNADIGINAIVIACKGRTFVAGADIKEFGKPPLAPSLPDLCNLIEASAKPVVAAIHGTALGGGCEIALACHGRIAVADAQLGLPEVKLGIIPGAGGTQRLPRLVAMDSAIDMISSGRMVGAGEAMRLGLIDQVAMGDLVPDAANFAASLAGRPLRRTSALPVKIFDTGAVGGRISEVERKARGQLSPGKAARTALAAASLPFAEGLAFERATFLELVATEQSAALRHVFFAEREAAKFPQLDGAVARKLAAIGVAGAGTMGSGIAVALAEAGYKVVVVEQTPEAATVGRARIEAIHKRNMDAGRIDDMTFAARLAATSIASSLDAFKDCDLVIEAVFDDLGVKQDLFRSLSNIVRPSTILATNTSYLDPHAIANAASHPERVIGLHFFSPANLMRLTEIVPIASTSPETVATALALTKRMKKLGIWAGTCEGFIGNRIFSAYRKQCEYMAEDGALPHEVDAAMEAFGLPMGPFAVFDLAGLDIAWARRKRLSATRDPGERYVRIADQLCELGRFGQKTGAGWYAYEDGKRRTDPGVTAIIEAEATRSGINRKSISDDDIRARIIAAMVNEAAKILQEGMAQRASDIDLVFINGYGWPAWRGGPMFQADQIGLNVILAEVRGMQRRDGTGWEPAKLLVEMAEAGRRFGG